MNFATTESERLILATVDQFMTRHAPPEEIRRRDAAHEPPYDLLPLIGAAGLFGLPVPEQYGGTQQGWTTVALVQERLGFLGYPVASIFNRVVGFGLMSFLTYGSAEQKASFIPRLVAGDCLIALALTEPSAGSDASAITAHGERTSDGWIVNGRKTWISDAAGADYLLTAVRTERGSIGSAGISMLLIPRTSSGITMTNLPKVGNNCMPSWDIGFDDVVVPESGLLGTEGEGFAHLMSTLQYSRASMAATVCGCAQAAVDCALAYAKERHQFGRAIGSFQVIRHRLADMQMRVDASRLMTCQLAWLIETGADCRRQAAQAKIMSTETLQFVTDHGMQILASAGYSMDSDMQRYWRDARLYSFGEGSNEILREIVARRLGL